MENDGTAQSSAVEMPIPETNQEMEPGSTAPNSTISSGVIHTTFESIALEEKIPDHQLEAAGASKAPSITSATPVPSHHSVSQSTITDTEIPRPAYIPPFPSRLRAASLPNLNAAGPSGSAGGDDADRRPGGGGAPPLHMRQTEPGRGRPMLDDPLGVRWDRSPSRSDTPSTAAAPRQRTIFQQIGSIFTNDGREQRKRAGILCRLAFSFAQIVLIIVFLSLSASVWRSKPNSELTEWHSCSRPLGIWNALWAARITLGLLLGVWEWKRQRDRARRGQNRAGGGDTESRTSRPSSRASSPSRNMALPSRISPGAPLTSIVAESSSSASGPSGSGPSGAMMETPASVASLMATRISQQNAQPSSSRAPGRTTPRRQSTSDSRAGPNRDRRQNQRSTSSNERGTDTGHGTSGNNNNSNTSNRSSAMFDRFETCLTVMALAHFVGNNILLFTSVHSCRFTSPHIWWLAFGIACLGYIVVIEVLLIAIVVFVLGPILLLTLNLLMLCLGRPVDRHGNVQIRAEIPKMDQKWVDQIPLVVYIPPRSEDDDEDEDSGQTPGGGGENLRPQDESSTAAASTHAYPPPQNAEASSSKSTRAPSTSGGAHITANGAGPSSSNPNRPRRGRFLFLRKKSPPAASQPANSKSNREKQSKLPLKTSAAAISKVAEEDPWEARFERGEHPFVTLDGNRAACAICLCDFVEPPKRGSAAAAANLPQSPTSGSGTPTSPSGAGSSSTPTAARADSPKIQDTNAEEKEKVVEAEKKLKKSKQKRLEDTIDEEQAGVAGEPLRLLECGHVFHRSCLDPWLLDVSGRCPVCQAKVDIKGKGTDRL